MNFLKQSTAATVKLGPFLDDTDGKTAETALSIAQADIRLTKNGGAFAQTNNSAGATHDAAGWYGVPLDTTDTNTLGRLTVAIHKTGALPVWHTFTVLAANVFDGLIGGTDVLQVDVSQWKDATAPAMTGDSFARLGAPAGASVSADVAAVKSDTGGIKTKTDYLPSATAGAAGGVFIAGSNAATSVTTALTANITGNLSGSVGSVTGAVGSVTGSVGSVTGAVGSVTGNVGGNVAGSVGSVTGAVGSVTGNVGGSVASVVAGVTLATDAVSAAAMSAAAVDEILDEVVEGTTTLRQALRLLLSAIGAKVSGGGTTTITFRDIGDTKNRIVATVDSSGNRSAVTLDGS